jgi:hypothetical protein
MTILELQTRLYPCPAIMTAADLKFLQPFYWAEAPLPPVATRPPVVRPPPPPLPRRLVPPRKNTLFWCVFIEHYGYDVFQSLSPAKRAARELEEQIQIAQYLKTPSLEKQVLSPKVTKKQMQEMQSDLMVHTTHISPEPWALLPAYALYTKSTIVVWWGAEVYYKVQLHAAERTIHLYKTHNHFSVSLCQEPPPNFDAAVALVQPNRPLRPLSYYKVADLRQMADRLHVAVDGDTTKQALYNLVNNRLQEVVGIAPAPPPTIAL